MYQVSVSKQNCHLILLLTKKEKEKSNICFHRIWVLHILCKSFLLALEEILHFVYDIFSKHNLFFARFRFLNCFLYWPNGLSIFIYTGISNVCNPFLTYPNNIKCKDSWKYKWMGYSYQHSLWYEACYSVNQTLGGRISNPFMYMHRW